MKDIRSSLGPLFLLSKHMGMCSFNFSNVFELCKSGLLTSILIFGYYFYCCYAVIEFSLAHYEENDILGFIGQALQTISGFIYITAVFLECVNYNNLANRWFRKLSMIQKAFKIDYKHLRKSVNSYLIVGLFNLLMMIFLNIIFNLDNPMIGLHMVNIMTIPMCESILSSLRYICCLQLISKKTSTINYLLIRNIQHTNNKVKNPRKIIAGNKYPLYLNEIYELLDLFDESSKINGFTNAANYLSILLMTIFTVYFLMGFQKLENIILKSVVMSVMSFWFFYAHILFLYVIHCAVYCMMEVRI